MTKAFAFATGVDLRRLILAVGLFLALALAILIAGSARVAQTVAAGASGGLERLAPGALGTIRFELAQIGSRQVEVEPALARRALGGMPTASDPFTALAAAQLARNPKGSPQEVKLLSEALRRDPRSRTARILLLRQMAATGDLQGAFNQLAVFARLNPGLVETIMEAITGRINSPGQVDEAFAAIDRHPILYRPFVFRMAAKRKPPEVVLRLVERLPAGVMADREVREAVIQQLVRTGEYAVARNLWQKGNAAGASGLVHSPDFADSKAPPPFNWELIVDSTGAAERARSGGLNLVYYDRDPGALAKQLLTLTPGSYRASVDYEVISGEADNVRLQVTCYGSDKVLGAGALVARRAGPSRLVVNFAVPGMGCTGQELSLVGVASEARGETQLLVKRIDLTPGGSTQ